VDFAVVAFFTVRVTGTIVIAVGLPIWILAILFPYRSSRSGCFATLGDSPVLECDYRTIWLLGQAKDSEEDRRQ
jgi:hypothetical protein